MKHLIISILTTIAFTGVAQIDSEIAGTYQGKNVFVQNPINHLGTGFCTLEVKVNGKKYDFENAASVFEIRLSRMELEKGDPIVIIFTHAEECSPKILNYDAFSDQSLRINSGYLDGKTLYWKEEYADFSYRVEHFRWNKWTTVDLQINEPNADDFYAANLNGTPHSFVNTFRIVAENSLGIKAYSSNFTLNGNQESIVFEIDEEQRVLTFTAPTHYELFNDKGDCIQVGTSATIDFSDIDSGAYKLNFDNAQTRIKIP